MLLVPNKNYGKGETSHKLSQTNERGPMLLPEHASYQKDKLSIFILKAGVPLGIIHDLGMLWKQRDFVLISSGIPIKNGQLVNDTPYCYFPMF